MIRVQNRVVQLAKLRMQGVQDRVDNFGNTNICAIFTALHILCLRTHSVHWESGRKREGTEEVARGGRTPSVHWESGRKREGNEEVARGGRTPSVHWESGRKREGMKK